MLLRSVNRKCGSEVLLKSAVKSVAEKCRTELLLGSFDHKCAQKVLVTGIAHCSEASLRSVALRSVAHVAEIRV